MDEFTPQPRARTNGRGRFLVCGRSSLLGAYGVVIAGLGLWYFAFQRPEQRRFAAECQHLREARGSLMVRTEPPGADVRVGGFAATKSPLTLADAKPGRYPVQIVLDGFDPVEEVVDVVERRTADLGVVKLARSTGTVDLKSVPAGLPVELRMTRADGACDLLPSRKEKTPAKIALPSGEYEAIFERKHWDDVTRKVFVTRGQSQTVEAAFPSATLSLNSEGAGTRFQVSLPPSDLNFGVGADVCSGTTPAVLELPPDTYTVRFDCSGYDSPPEECKLAAGQTKAISPRLTKTVSMPEQSTQPVAGQNWENSLGMRFVPVPGTSVLFSIWDTRVSDYRDFVQETRRPWRMPHFRQESDHPVVMVSWDDAKAFCQWLTAKDRKSARLMATQQYRLPTDAEWSKAVGLTEDATQARYALDGATEGFYPWGTRWPLPFGEGNYGGRLRADPFEHTSPVGSFPANQFGLYDMGGNVSQWCEDFYDNLASSRRPRITRGESWDDVDRKHLLASYRGAKWPISYFEDLGFRCVVTVADPVPSGPTPLSEKQHRLAGADAEVEATQPEANLPVTPPAASYGAVQIESEAAGAEVYLVKVQGNYLSSHFQFQGTTPLVLDGLPEGDFVASLGLPGHTPAQVEVKIIAHKIAMGKAVLKPIALDALEIGDSGMKMMPVASGTVVLSEQSPQGTNRVTRVTLAKPYCISNDLVQRRLVESFQIPLLAAAENQEINDPYEQYDADLREEREQANAYASAQQRMQNRSDSLQQTLGSLDKSDHSGFASEIKHELWNIDRTQAALGRGPREMDVSPLSSLNRRQREAQRLAQQAAWAANQPAEILWAEARDFCLRLTRDQRENLPEGYIFALPTEAEWEMAWQSGLKKSVWQSLSDDGQRDLPPEWCSDVYAALPGGDLLNPSGPAPGTEEDRRVCQVLTADRKTREPVGSRTAPSTDRRAAFRIALIPDPADQTEAWMQQTLRDNAAQTRRDPTDPEASQPAMPETAKR